MLVPVKSDPDRSGEQGTVFIVVVAVIMLFIAQTTNSWLYYVVVPSSIFGQIFVGTLELLFAFVQAYIFAFLATLFIGMAVHPH